MDKVEFYELCEVVAEAVKKALETEEEKWLVEDEFIEHFQMFTKDWLKHNAEKYEMVRMKAPGGRSWAYPMHWTNRKLQEGYFNITK